MMDALIVVPLEQAKERGLRRYFTGKPCKHGHISEWSVANKQCLKCVSLIKAKYQKANAEKIRQKTAEYRAGNPDKVAAWIATGKPKMAAIQKKSREKHREKYLAKQRERNKKNAEKMAEYRIVNKEKIAAWHRENYQRNKEKILARNAAYMAVNKEEMKEAGKKYYLANKARYLAAWAKRKAHKINATPGWADFDQIREIYRKAEKQGMHVDHIIPLQGELVCGLHVPANLQLLDPVANMSKGNKFNPEEHDWSARCAY